MQATLTEFSKGTGKLLDAVMHQKQSLILTQDGATVAEIRPHPHAISGVDFARLWKSRSKLDQATAETVAQNIAEINKSECGSS